MYTTDEVKELCAEMAADLKCTEEDLKLSDCGLFATIPYFCHGRMEKHTIDLELIAKTALIFARKNAYIHGR